MTGQPAEPATPLQDLAGQAHRVHAELARLVDTFNGAVANPGSIPQPEATLKDQYPFSRSLATVLREFGAWASHLAGIADAAGEPLTAAAAAIRHHVERCRRVMGKPDSHSGGVATDGAYSIGMRNGLGGVSGDMAAAFHPGVQLALAALLDAVAADDRDATRAAADLVSRQYLAARAEDDDRYSGRTDW